MQKREQTVLVIGVASCALIWGLGRGLPALETRYAERRTAALEVVRRAAAAKRAAELHSAVAESLQARQRGASSVLNRLFTGRSATLLASNASASVMRVASASNLRISSMQVVTPERKGAETRIIRMTLTGAGDVRGVMRFLSAIESAKRLTRVVSIAISQPDVAGRGNSPESLNLQLTLDALGVIATPR